MRIYQKIIDLSLCFALVGKVCRTENNHNPVVITYVCGGVNRLVCLVVNQKIGGLSPSRCKLLYQLIEALVV